MDRRQFCSVEVLEALNLIPAGLKWAGMVAFGINVLTCLICAIWLVIKREHSSLKFAQPFFLVLVLIGCVVSSSTILALAQEDEGNGPVPGCMAIPWLYLIGFCITFGTLFAKLRRTYIIFQSVASMKRVSVSVNETLAVIGGLVLLDAVVLITWTIVDPLKWERVVVTEDVFGHPLESVGKCTSEYWAPFSGTIAFLHFVLLCVACWYCYLSRCWTDELQTRRRATSE
jgi:7 transmembrane sweet-taste receptor of 3 GCPR